MVVMCRTLLCCGCAWLTCCIPVNICTRIFVTITSLVQLAMCIMFLYYHEWYVFIAVAFVFIAHTLFFFTIIKKKYLLLPIFICYEVIWTFIFLGLLIWFILVAIWPDSYNLWYDYYYYYEEEYIDLSAMSSMMWSYSAFTLCAFLVQSYTTRIVIAYMYWLRELDRRLHSHRVSGPSHITVVNNTPLFNIQSPPPNPTVYPPPPPTVYHPPPPPPSNAAYSNPMYPPQRSTLDVPNVPSAPPVSPSPEPQRRVVYPEIHPSSSQFPDSRPDAPPAYDDYAMKGSAYPSNEPINKY